MKSRNYFSVLLIGCIAFLSSAFVNPNNIITDSAEAATDSPTFVEFLSLFEKVEMPFEIGLDDFDKYQSQNTSIISKKKSKRRSLGTDEQTLRQFLQDDLYISRMGPPALIPVARFYADEGTIAIIYGTSRRGFVASTDTQFKLALFDLKGNKLPNQKEELRMRNQSFLLGQYSTYGNTQTFSIDANGVIVQKTYKVIWKNDLRKKGTTDNEITDYVLEKIEQFQIEEEGIVAAKTGEGSKDRASID